MLVMEIAHNGDLKKFLQKMLTDCKYVAKSGECSNHAYMYVHAL